MRDCHINGCYRINRNLCGEVIEKFTPEQQKEIEFIADKLWGKLPCLDCEDKVCQKEKLNDITKNLPIMGGEDNMIELDPDNDKHREWFEEN